LDVENGNDASSGRSVVLPQIGASEIRGHRRLSTKTGCPVAISVLLHIIVVIFRQNMPNRLVVAAVSLPQSDEGGMRPWGRVMGIQNRPRADSTGLVRLRSSPIVAKQPEFQSIRAPAGWRTDVKREIVSCLEQRILPRGAPWPANQRSLWMSEPRLCALTECRAKLTLSQAALLQVPRPKAVRGN